MTFTVNRQSREEHLSSTIKKELLTTHEQNLNTLSPTIQQQEAFDTLAETQSKQLTKPQKMPLQLAAYREEGQAGHGNLIIENNADIQGFIADMPDNFDITTHQTDALKCKAINQDGQTGQPATVCIGSNDQIPAEGDVDFVATGDQWYKIRSGTAVVSIDPGSIESSIEAKGSMMGLPYGIYPSINEDLILERTFFDNLSQSANVVHKADESPYPWIEPQEVLEPIQYLNRLENEAELGPLPVPPPPKLISK